MNLNHSLACYRYFKTSVFKEIVWITNTKMYRRKNLVFFCLAVIIIKHVHSTEQNFSASLDVYTNVQTQTQTSRIDSQKTAEYIQSDLQNFDEEEIEIVHTICDICYCPQDENQKPYIINCKALLLKDIPIWSDRLTVEHTLVSSVHVELDNNEFETVSLINECNVIDGISLGHNKILGIEPFAFAELPNLKNLCLSNNQIESIHPSAFKTADGQTSLMEILDLSNNNIHHLESGIFDDLTNLRELNLEGNPFGFLDSSAVSTINSLPNLKYLNIAMTGIDDIPQSLEDTMKHLQRLNIAHNNFIKVPEMIQNGRHLLELIMSDNPFHELKASSFIKLQSLELLYINDMASLEAIYKGTFYPLTSLLTLKCNNNPSLTVIETGAFWNKNGEGPLHLKKLELKNNNLTTLDKELLGDMEIHHLDLRNNPLNCSCSLAWIKTYKGAQDYLNETSCWYPIDVNGKYVTEVDFSCSKKVFTSQDTEKEGFTWSYVTIIFVSFLAITLFLTVILLVIILIWCCRRHNSVKYNKLDF